MNSYLLISILRFTVLFLAQVWLFNNIEFWGFLNPFVYILYVLLYPVNANKSFLLISSFFMGLLMDMFFNTGGVHTTATLVLAYIRPTLFRFAYGVSYEYNTIKITDKFTSETFILVLLSVGIHHFILYNLEIFKIALLWDILWKSIANIVLTTTTVILILLFLKPTKR